MADQDAQNATYRHHPYFPGTTPCRRSMATYLRKVALAAGALLALSACTADSALMSDDPLASEHPLWMVPVNQTDQWAINMAVDRYWMGDGTPHGGSARACCYPSPKDWSKPVTVHWTWGTELDSKTKAVIKPREPHSMVLHFPPGGPAKDDRYLCLIVRDRVTAELAFSRAATRCATK
jgi:hypothetical protein